MKKLFFLTIFIFFTGCSERSPEYYYIYPVSEVGSVGDDLPISRALVSKMLAHILDNTVNIHSLDTYINFYDIFDTDWYFPYINIVYHHGIMSGTGNLFEPKSPLTLIQAQYILDNLQANVALNITDENKNTPISFALWNQIYSNALESLSGDQTVSQRFSIFQQNLVVLATETNNPALAGGSIITNKGLFVATGFVNDNFLDKEISVLVRGQDIITVLEVTSMSPILNYAFVTGSNNNGLSIFMGGVERVFTSSFVPRISRGDIISLQIYNGTVLNYTIYDNIIDNTTIERVTNDFIELFGYGRIALSENFVVYNQVGIDSGIPSWQTPRQLVVGTEIARFIWDRDYSYLIAAVIEESPSPRYIRVALNTTGFTSLVHDSIELTADIDFTVTDALGTRVYTAGQIVSFTHQSHVNGYRAYIDTQGDGRIQVLNITRQWPSGVSPSYHGSMEIAWEGNGFSLINVVPMEKYLQAVVPSEMPSSFGLEASMLQAVTARSYAYGQFLANRQAHFGANVEDSVMSQVYNNIPENSISIEAVNNTRGQVLSYNGQVVSTNFFSTSAGVTANSGDVWAVNNRLPANTPTFLQSVRQYAGADFGDLSNEDNARVFFNNRNIDAYDSMSPWFRWDVTMTAEQVANSINSQIKARYNANPFLIKTLGDDDVFRSTPFRPRADSLENIEQVCACGGTNGYCIYGIGDLVDIQVATRGVGGNIMELIIVGTEATVKVITEFNIRTLLAPRTDDGIISLNRWDGTTVNNFSMMPSSFFTMERLTDNDGNIMYVRFIGGGFGHGVGMSQYGARGMLNRGYSYLEILLHFYTGVDVVTIY